MNSKICYVNENGTVLGIGGDAGRPNRKPITSVRELDTENKKWKDESTRKPMKVARRESHSCLALNCNKVLVAGGYNSSTRNSFTDSVEIYDLQADEWSDGPKLPVTGYHGTAMVNGVPTLVIAKTKGI